MNRRDRILMIVSFAAIHVVWGTTYLAIRYAVETIPPLLTAGLRHTIGGAALFTYCWSRGMRPTLPQWRASIVTGTLFFLIGHGALHWAELYVASGLAALLVATEPVWVAAFARGGRLSAAGLIGLILGVMAVTLLVGSPRLSSTREFIGAIAILIGALSWAIGIVYSQSAPAHRSPLMAASMSLLSGGALLVITSLLTSGVPARAFSMRSILALAYLIVFGSLTFTGYTWLLTRCSAVLVATHAYTNPIIAVLLGLVIAHERVTVRMVIAAVMVIVAIALVRRGVAAGEHRKENEVLECA